MRVLLQRVSSAEVYVDGKLKGSCAKGILIFVCAMKGDDENVVKALTQKISKLRIFESSEGKMDLTLHDIGGEALVVSQFTLAADTKKGNRPGFSSAANPQDAKYLYELFISNLRRIKIPTQHGIFGASMKVELVNSGPATFWLDSNS
tara:strand:- start:424 stop:867 length:444 start_codon:yes stop_codon:yes gene_type:complete